MKANVGISYISSNFSTMQLLKQVMGICALSFIIIQNKEDLLALKSSNWVSAMIHILFLGVLSSFVIGAEI